jgi:hypothetical protein
MIPDAREISYLRYRQEVVSRWPSSPYKQVVLTAIEDRLRRLNRPAAAPETANDQIIL